MEDELRNLKELLDDTYYKDLSLSKMQKKKIVKKAISTSKPTKILPNLKYALSLVVALTCVLVLGLSMVLPKYHQASNASMKEKQVAIIHFQEELIKIAQKQNKTEQALLDERDFKNRNDVMEGYRTQIILEGTKIQEELKKLSVPPELSEYEEEINQSLEELINTYEKKNEFYKSLNLENYRGIPPYEEAVDHLIIFSDKIGMVYTKLKLFPPNFFILFEFYFN